MTHKFGDIKVVPEERGFSMWYFGIDQGESEPGWKPMGVFNKFVEEDYVKYERIPYD